MPAKLFCKTGELAGREHVIDREATIGSAPDNTVVLPFRSISRQHARIALDEATATWIVEDLESRNGTRLDHRPVSGRETLGSLHVITFADYHDFVFQIVEPPGAGSSGRANRTGDRHTTRSPFPPDFVLPPSMDVGRAKDPHDAPDRELPSGRETVAGLLVGAAVPAALLAAAPIVRAMPSVLHVSPWCLELQDPAATATTRFRLSEGTHTIGRSLECDVRVDNRTMSRRHATITVIGGRVTVSDLASANGTFIRDVRIAREVDVPPGTPLRFGEVVMTLFHDPLRGASEWQ